MRLDKAGDQGRGGRELHGVAGQDRLTPEHDRKMRLADAGRAKQETVLVVGDPAGRGQISDLRGVDRQLCVEVEHAKLLD
jgi:hypothetical protein